MSDRNSRHAETKKDHSPHRKRGNRRCDWKHSAPDERDLDGRRSRDIEEHSIRAELEERDVTQGARLRRMTIGGVDVLFVSVRDLESESMAGRNAAPGDAQRDRQRGRRQIGRGGPDGQERGLVRRRNVEQMCVHPITAAGSRDVKGHSRLTDDMAGDAAKILVAPSD